MDLYIHLGNYSIFIAILPFPMHQRRWEWVDGGTQLWMTPHTPSLFGKSHILSIFSNHLSSIPPFRTDGPHLVATSSGITI